VIVRPRTIGHNDGGWIAPPGHSHVAFETTFIWLRLASPEIGFS
jgi:hypothetical protein